MSRDYSESRIKDALRLNAGNEAKTKRQVHAWLYEDHKFLLELVAPHLGGIIAYSVGRTKNKMRAQENAAKALLDAEAAAEALTVEQAKNQNTAHAQATIDALNEAQTGTAQQAKKKKERDFGETMLRSFISDNAAKFGHESSAPPVRRKAASQDHIDTMHMLVAASKNKKSAEE